MWTWLRLVPVAKQSNPHGIAPKARSGAASGMLGTARATGQAIGTALVAIMLAKFGIRGTSLSLLIGPGFAAMACLFSLSRMSSICVLRN